MGEQKKKKKEGVIIEPFQTQVEIHVSLSQVETISKVGERQRMIFLWVPSEWKTCNKKEVRDLSRPIMSLILVVKSFKRPILQEQFIKEFIKLEHQMCELNYKGIKIEIGVKLGDQKCNFTYKKWNIYRKSLRCWHVVLTRDSQRLRLTVNV